MTVHRIICKLADSNVPMFHKMGSKNLKRQVTVRDISKPDSESEWTLLKGWSKSYNTPIPEGFPRNPWILRETDRFGINSCIYISKSEQTTPPEGEWHTFNLKDPKEPEFEKDISVSLVDGKSVKVTDNRPKKAAVAEPAPQTEWILQRGWSKSYKTPIPRGFPSKPWVLRDTLDQFNCCLYISKADQATPPSGQWHAFNVQKSYKVPKFEKGISVSLVNGGVKVTDNRPAKASLNFYEDLSRTNTTITLDSDW